MLPEGSPPTLAEYRRLMADASRNLTDDPIGAHDRAGSTKRHKVRRDVDPDILRRQGEPVPGERTIQEAAELYAAKMTLEGDQS